MAEPSSLHSIKLNSPTTFTAAAKHEPIQSPPYLPPREPLLPPFALEIIASIQQELRQSQPSIPPPEPIPPPLAVVKTKLGEPGQPEQQQASPREEEERTRPQLLKSIADLASLSNSLHSFNCKFDELTKHLDSINQAIDSKFNELPQQEQQIETQTCLRPTETEIETVKEGPKTDSRQRSPRGIQRFCERMRFKALRKYIVSNLSNVTKLREEIPSALKLAPEPAKLVLDCVGQFFLMGKKACTQQSHTILAKQALLLLLELFLSMRGNSFGESGIKVAVKLKVEAESVAIGWRRRLIREGGLANASETDARGLLLFVACFGIPRVFSNQDLGDLVKLKNLRGISDALKASPLLPGKIPVSSILGEFHDIGGGTGLCARCLFLVGSRIMVFRNAEKQLQKLINPLKMQRLLHFLSVHDKNSHGNRTSISDVIDTMVKNGMYFDAVEVASIFGLEGKFSPKTILTSFLQESTKAFERAKHEALNNPVVLIKANEKQLDALKSTARYLEDRSSDAMEILSSWQVKEKIVKLEEEIADLCKSIKDKKGSRRKRKLDKMGPSSPVKSQEEKRSRFATEGSPLPKTHANQLCEQPTASVAEGDVLIPNSCNTNNDSIASAAPHGSTCSFSKNGIGQMGGTAGVIPSSSSGADENVEVKAGQMTTGNCLPYDWRQGSVPQSTSMWFADLFGSSPSVEGFVGLLDVRTPADRYSFADSLM